MLFAGGKPKRIGLCFVIVQFLNGIGFATFVKSLTALIVAQGLDVAQTYDQNQNDGGENYFFRVVFTSYWITQYRQSGCLSSLNFLRAVRV